MGGCNGSFEAAVELRVLFRGAGDCDGDNLESREGVGPMEEVGLGVGESDDGSILGRMVG